MSDQTPRIPDRHASEIIIRPAGHKIPPMSEWGEPIETPHVPDQTPHVPDLHWHAKYGLLELDGGIVWIHLYNRESLRHHLRTGPDSNPPLPSDAVKLGDVEALHRELRAVMSQRDDAQRAGLKIVEQREALKREIREAYKRYFDVSADDPRTDGGPLELEDAIHALEAIRAIVEGENR